MSMALRKAIQKVAVQLDNARHEIMHAVDDGKVSINTDEMRDAYELILVLARIIDGKTVYRAFGAPGDWGYSNPVGAALNSLYREQPQSANAALPVAVTTPTEAA